MVRNDRVDAFARAQLLEPVMLAGGVGAEAIDRHHRRHAKPAHIGKVPGEVGKAFFECGDIFFA